MSNSSTSPARSRAWSSRRAVSALGLMALVGGLLFTVSAPAGAAYPGANGLIAFERNIGNLEIFSINPNGTGATNLTNNAATDQDPSWSPDGSKIAFASDRSGTFDIWTMNANGTNQTNVTPAAVGNQFHPTWSPNGSTLAFENVVTLGISTVPSGGGAITDITFPDGLTFTSDFDPSWGPGNQIAVSRLVFPGGTSDLFKIAANGTGVTPVGVIGGTEVTPDWSPNSQRLVFDTILGPGLSLINADGLALTPLTGAVDANPAYSPDGLQVVFDRASEIRTIPAAGGGVTQVTTGANDADPSWQPTNVPAPAPPPPPLPGFERLTVAKTGTGSGTVTSNLPGINCGADCVEDYVTNTPLTLFATPAAGSTFGGWNVAGCTTTTCSLTLSTDMVVNPVFTSTAVSPAPAPPSSSLDPRCGQVGVICGDNGHNVLTGTPNADLILGFGGDDNCQGRGGNDVIICGLGNDILRGGPGNDTLISYAGRDHMRGGPGNDTISSGAGRDRLIGGKGVDSCKSGPGKDLVRGCETAR